MARYKCGNRECTDDELDTIEKLRAGSLSAVDPKESGVDMSRLESGLEAIGDKIREAVESLPEKVGADVARRPVNFADYSGFKKHRETCPECQAAYEAELKEALPTFAQEHGYTTVGPQPEPEDTVANHVHTETKKGPEEEPEEEEDPEEELSLLDRVIPVKG